MALYRCFVVVTMLVLISVSLFQPTFSRGYGSSERKRVRVNMEHLRVQHHEGIAEAAVVNSTSDQTFSELTFQQSHPQIQEETTSQENGQSKALRQRKLKPKFHCKRQIPGGPDPQHH